MAISLESYVEKTVVLLEKEREAEIEETRILQENVSPRELERRGVGLFKLRIASQHTGLYGRNILMFEPYYPGKQLPAHNFTPGDIAGVSLSSGDGSQETLASGIVSRVTHSAVSVAFDENQDTLTIEDSSQYKLVKLANDVTYRRLKKCLSTLRSYRTGPSSNLINVLFGDSKVSPPYSEARDGKLAVFKDLPFFNPGLNESQQEAVRFALHQRELAIIHGPPGTGKTTTVVEIIQQAVRQGLKVLACAPSNIAVDNLVERLANQKTRVVRLGHPARLLPTIQRHALDAILAGSDETRLVEDVRKDMDKTMAKMRKCRDRGERQSLREDLKHLRKELRQREEAATKGILQRAQVVLATLTSATDDGPLKLTEEEHFDLVVIDECSQALEAACWIALLRGPRCVIAGDHLQLPPTILSHKAAAEGLAVTLMERQLELHGDAIMRMLTTQYRMHQDIMIWPSRQLYDGKLTAHPSVENHLLRDLPGVEDTEDTKTPLLLVDTAGCNLWELDVDQEVSKGNEGEADIVADHVETLIKAGLPADQIAVIAPYNLQVELLRLRLSAQHPKLEVKSVDGFQGREKEAVVLSLVRSNQKREVGFLAEDRRINVAITRARRHLAVVCDSETVSHHDFLKSMVAYMSEHGEVRSAFQYETDGATSQNMRPAHLQEKLSGTGNVRSAPRQGQKKTSKPAPKTSNYHPPRDGLPKPVQQESLRDDETRRAELQVILEKFSADKSRQSHAFPSSLTSFERFVVHEIADMLGLCHISQGEGTERHIVVSRPMQSKPKEKKEKSITEDVSGKVPTGTDPTKAEVEKKGRSKDSVTEGKKGGAKKLCNAEVNESKIIDHETVSNNTTNAGMTSTESKTTDSAAASCQICDKCGKEIPLSNFQLHDLHCKALQTDSSSTVEKPQAKTKKKKNKDKGKGSSAKVEEEEDFDALIAAAMKDNRQCHQAKCKSSVMTVGQICPFCDLIYCLSHHMPEVHGCGEKARSHARILISRDGVLHRGSGVPNKHPDPAKRANLQRKLDKKLDDMAGKRKQKPAKKS